MKPPKILSNPFIKGQGSTTTRQWRRAFKVIREGGRVLACPECKGYQFHNKGCANAKAFPFVGGAMRIPGREKRGACELQRKMCGSWDSKLAVCSRRDCCYFPKITRTVLCFPGDPDLNLTAVESAERVVRRKQRGPGDPDLNSAAISAGRVVRRKKRDPADYFVTNVAMAARGEPARIARRKALHGVKAGDGFFGAFHEMRIKPGVMIAGSLMGGGEYAAGPLPWQLELADYCVRQGANGQTWGIYLRKYNVRVSTFAPGSDALREALDQMFTAAHALKQQMPEPKSKAKRGKK